jgi:hypothetical protein
MDETYVYGWESWMDKIVVYDYIYVLLRVYVWFFSLKLV